MHKIQFVFEYYKFNCSVKLFEEPQALKATVNFPYIKFRLYDEIHPKNWPYILFVLYNNKYHDEHKIMSFKHFIYYILNTYDNLRTNA